MVCKCNKKEEKGRNTHRDTSKCPDMDVKAASGSVHRLIGVNANTIELTENFVIASQIWRKKDILHTAWLEC